MSATPGAEALSDQTRYDSWTQRFTLPRSWVPLLLILGIFVTKFAVGAATGLQPGLRGNAELSRPERSICRAPTMPGEHATHP
ncbi:MAG: hypothetical protein IPO43_17780 [Rhodoferax sp.]|nr:hypothetical protein [Rhodoferax sp.]